MRSVRILLLVLVLTPLALAGSGFGCSSTLSSNDPEVERGIATVDSLDVPSEIAASDTLSVHLHGTVGPNGCYSLERIDEQRSSGQVTLTPVVAHRTGPDVMCTMAIVSLDATHRVTPPFEPGTLQVVVPQPNGPDVTAAVTVH